MGGNGRAFSDRPLNVFSVAMYCRSCCLAATGSWTAEASRLKTFSHTAGLLSPSGSSTESASAPKFFHGAGEL